MNKNRLLRSLTQTFFSKKNTQLASANTAVQK